MDGNKKITENSVLVYNTTAAVNIAYTFKRVYKRSPFTLWHIAAASSMRIHISEYIIIVIIIIIIIIIIVLLLLYCNRKDYIYIYIYIRMGKTTTYNRKKGFSYSVILYSTFTRVCVCVCVCGFSWYIRYIIYRFVLYV
jgi:hypothetical protein